MVSYRNISASRAYREALAHPVFVNDRHGSESGRVACAASAPSQNSSDENAIERQDMARRILEFLDTSTKYWPNFAPHAPELRILMDVLLQEYAGRPVAVTDACMAAHVPCTSALRSIDRLMEDGLLDRRADPGDSRRKLLGLTSRSRALIAVFMDDCREECDKQG